MTFTDNSDSETTSTDPFHLSSTHFQKIPPHPPLFPPLQQSHSDQHEDQPNINIPITTIVVPNNHRSTFPTRSPVFQSLAEDPLIFGCGALLRIVINLLELICIFTVLVFFSGKTCDRHFGLVFFLSSRALVDSLLILTYLVRVLHTNLGVSAQTIRTISKLLSLVDSCLVIYAYFQLSNSQTCSSNATGVYVLSWILAAITISSWLIPLAIIFLPCCLLPALLFTLSIVLPATPIGGQPQAASDDELSRLKQFQYATDMNDMAPTPHDGTIPRNDNEYECTICMLELQPADQMCELACGHSFHTACVQRWLKINRTCPLCRSDAIPPVQQVLSDPNHLDDSSIVDHCDDIFVSGV